jgi:hypothetical protein
MKIVRSFPYSVREIEHCWIPLWDGSRLAARIWLPDCAESSPVPAILEYIPYRKRDGTRWRDEPMHRYFAGHGYAAVRVDLRGTGESDGILRDEYLEQEHQDGEEVIQWIATRPWCTGDVGMMGKSWGGFNALQLAARQPQPLKAIITVCSTDDRYADDAHYMGGCLLNENLLWGSMLFTLNALPPDPALVGERWRAMWLERLESNPLFAEVWLRHPFKDDYWRHGSVGEDYGRVACPVYAVGGWADAYSNAVPRLLAGLRVPRKGLVGPWAHLYPHEGIPGPPIGFLQEALRWWDRWLKGEDNGIMEEPVYRVWMPESVRPRSFYHERPGRWVAEESWPSPRIVARRYYLNRGKLDSEPMLDQKLEHRSPQTVGLAGGSWCSFGMEGELPRDQREEAIKSLIFESEPITERFEILGAPTVSLSFCSDRENALVAVRLNDVAPDGASTRVTYGLFNLTHRNGHQRYEPLVPGERYAVRLRLNEVAHVFPEGHRIRVALSSTYWPLVWPSPEPVTLGVYAGASFLELPVRPAHAADRKLEPFPEPEGAPRPAWTDLETGRARRLVTRDEASDETVVTIIREGNESGEPALSRLEAIDLVRGHATVERYRIREDDPLSAEAEVVHKAECSRGEWRVRLRTIHRLSATRRDFRLRAEIEAWEGEERAFHRSWDRSIPRLGV